MKGERWKKLLRAMAAGRLDAVVLVPGYNLRYLTGGVFSLRERPPTVVAGPTSAMPHGKAGDYRLRPGDAVLFDFGLTWQGYRADITRTFFAGDPSPEDLAQYGVVQAENELGRSIVRPGLAAGELDMIVTSFLRTSGYADMIRHRTGHGLGLDIHEEPYIQVGVAHELRPGHVFTIEPALYQTDRMGVGIEDDILVTATGAEPLTSFMRDPTVLC